MRKEITTIKLSKKTVELINKLKIHPRQPYEEVILKYVPKDEKEKKEREEKPKRKSRKIN